MRSHSLVHGVRTSTYRSGGTWFNSWVSWPGAHISWPLFQISFFLSLFLLPSKFKFTQILSWSSVCLLCLQWHYPWSIRTLDLFSESSATCRDCFLGPEQCCINKASVFGTARLLVICSFIHSEGCPEFNPGWALDKTLSLVGRAPHMAGWMMTGTECYGSPALWEDAVFCRAKVSEGFLEGASEPI